MAWWQTAFAERVADWAQAEGEPDSLIKLLSALEEEDGVDVRAAAAAAKEVVKKDHAYVQSLEWLHTLRSKFPEAFETDEWDCCVAEFESWLRDDLSSSAQDMSDASELAFVDRVAGLYGLPIDDDVWSEAEDTVQENERERDAEIEPDPDPDYGQLRNDRNFASETREIEVVFARLAD